MIYKNFLLAKDTQLQKAISENALVQSSVEYELLQVIHGTNSHLEEELFQIGTRVVGSMTLADSAFYIHYGSDYVYASDEQAESISKDLFENLAVGGKNYQICKQEDGYVIYVSSCNKVEGKNLCIISRTDVSQAYLLMESQITYFRWVLLGILLVASGIMFFVSWYLTRPLEKLNTATNEIAKGNYSNRVTVKSKDEIGMLATTFNSMAQAVSDRVADLQEMIHKRDQFVADFTHEIKTPMTTIIGYADTLRSMELPREEEIMALSYIFSEGKRLEAMSQKLFDLIYLREHEIEKQMLHTTDLGKEILTIATPILEQKHIELTVDMEPSTLFGNRELLITVFLNLIDNARKASKEGSEIEVKGRLLGEKEDLRYECTVTDHGIGMTKEDAKRICDEFFMVDKSRSRKEGGAGIGMSLVALILEHHDAKLLVESTLGEGTVMHIIFSDSCREETIEEAAE